jgi:amino acid permease
LPDSSLQDAG